MIWISFLFAGNCSFIFFLITTILKVCSCIDMYPFMPESVRFHGAGVTGDGKLPDISASNQTWVLWKSYKCS